MEWSSLCQEHDTGDPVMSLFHHFHFIEALGRDARRIESEIRVRQRDSIGRVGKSVHCKEATMKSTSSSRAKGTVVNVYTDQRGTYEIGLYYLNM